MALGHNLQHISYVQLEDGKWLPRLEAVQLIRDKVLRLYIQGVDKVAFVIAVYDDTHGWYLKTIPDGVNDNNLLTLPGGPLYFGGIIESAMR
jgi:hypothetical protein